MDNINEENNFLSFENDDNIPKPLKRIKHSKKELDENFDISANNNFNDNLNDFVPVETSNHNPFIQDNNSNYVFFFGTASSGKSVILSSILYYLNSQAGVIRPRVDTPMERDANVLFFDFLENLRKGNLPSRTVRDKVTRLDMVFEPNNQSKKTPPINLSFLETSGENHYEIRRGGEFHSSIDDYLSANVPLNIIIVTSYDTAHQDDTLINSFFDKLEVKRNSLKAAKVLLVISKWDLSGNRTVASEDLLDNFVRDRLPMSYSRLNTYNISKSYYTIGNIEKNEIGEEKLRTLNLHTAGLLSKWLYKSITGYDIDYEGTFGERIKWAFSNISLKG